MSVKQPDIDPADLGARTASLPGVERVREAAGEIPVHLVGGAVRDLLLGRGRADVDVVVEGDVEAIAARVGGEVTSHRRFGTATARVDGLTIDLAVARTETYASPGALPQVRPASLAEDLARRDFTVNAMALGLSGDPELVDPHGGLGDLRAGLLRVLHPRSFEDDPTRALRAARYASRLALALEPATAELLATADLNTVSADRVEAELRRLAAEADPAAGFALTREWGLIEVGDEELGLTAELTTLLAAAPWRGVAEPADAILAAVTGRHGGAPALAKADPERPSEGVAAAHGHSGVELALARAMGAGWLDRYVADWRGVRLDVGGGELLAAGVEEGPAVGRGLAAALRAKLDGEVEGAEGELALALEAARATDAGSQAGG